VINLGSGSTQGWNDDTTKPDLKKIGRTNLKKNTKSLGAKKLDGSVVKLSSFEALDKEMQEKEKINDDNRLQKIHNEEDQKLAVQLQRYENTQKYSSEIHNTYLESLENTKISGSHPIQYQQRNENKIEEKFTVKENPPRSNFGQFSQQKVIAAAQVQQNTIPYNERFKNKSGISSDEYFGRTSNPEQQEDLEVSRRLQGLQNQTAISSNMLFRSEPEQTTNPGFQLTNGIAQLKVVTKGLWSDLQNRYNSS